jgi:hypothetical protein
VFDGGFLLNLEFYCIIGGYFVSWVFDGGVIIVSWVLLYYGGYFVSWVFDGGFLLYLGCLLGASFVFWVSCGFWVLWVCSFLWVFMGFSCGLAELLLCS